jgi:Uma2 family endonuclease
MESEGCYRVPSLPKPRRAVAQVVGVRSPKDSWIRIFTKVVEYLGVGVPVVIVLDQVSFTASVYRAEELQRIFDNGDELTVPDVLPGFSVPVRRLFE